MIAVRAFFVGLREVFTLTHAEEVARSTDEIARLERRRLVIAARKRRKAARALSDPVPAIVLLRDAILHLSPSSAPRHELIAIDDLPFAEAEALREKLDVELTDLVRENDTRGLLAVRALRYGRFAAIGLLVVYFAATYIHSHFQVHNLAIGKVVITSPLRSESPTPDHVIDGRTRGTFGVHTQEVEHPFVLIDLGATHTIDRVSVYNRGDGWLDEVLPLRVELSNDGVRFDVIGSRTEHFVEWTVPAGGRTARFVRVSKPDRGYIALNEIEVFGR